MRFIQTFDLYPFLDSVVSLASAFVLGMLIGAERQYRQRTAGLRTAVLVAVGAAAFVDLAMRLGHADGAIRVIAYVVSGIGFLGAGVIMKEGMNVRGLNTAATLWCSAAVGACTGADMVAEGALITLFVIAGNTLLRPLVNAINRIPLNEQALEATYEVVVTTSASALAQVRETLVEYLEAAQYPVSDVTTQERGEESVEIVAKLISTAIARKELDQVVDRISGLPGVSHATWESSTAD
ncbi:MULTISPECIES: MgtC/SapB family protein [unclassified Bosea (in: a-proteobacteria)]|uniref:MgtC/SapB family protein n=1 Tax=unclassified Bosea (in: a-proteobacteria) TaxID=2653178 RepID=UPI00095586C2|nr:MULTISPECIES: MgtC/SapB family protein [unclassified Bosea (in: a-proteobacteria)]TAJ28859.1 MAG: MgtC/SapB family protein [Bosea sp. (in: a-proteobacteria)]SIQ21074.1 putative Mg2+ transporter-C (MgtC) family protein [Bosea sp. TND4EK4]